MNPNKRSPSEPARSSCGNPRIPKGDGPAPVKAYIAAMPGWKREVGRRLDAIVERVVPGVSKAVRWNTPFYGVDGQGWFLSLYCYSKKVQVTFLRGSSLDPLPPVASKQGEARSLDLFEGEGVDESLFETWVRQAAANPGEALFGPLDASPKPHPKVDAFVRGAESWRAEIEKLRGILLACGLEESLKWRKPCYSIDGSNVAILQPFRRFCALMFFQGTLLEDTHGLLRSQGENTQAAMRLEFTEPSEIKKTVVRDYVKQAIELRRQGQQVELRAKDELELPAELEQVFREDRKLEAAFRALTPGRQRGYVLHFAGAKQSKTRFARIEKCAPRILEGKGRNDR